MVIDFLGPQRHIGPISVALLYLLHLVALAVVLMQFSTSRLFLSVSRSSQFTFTRAPRDVPLRVFWFSQISPVHQSFRIARFVHSVHTLSCQLLIYCICNIRVFLFSQSIVLSADACTCRFAQKFCIFQFWTKFSCSTAHCTWSRRFVTSCSPFLQCSSVFCFHKHFSVCCSQIV